MAEKEEAPGQASPRRLLTREEILTSGLPPGEKRLARFCLHVKDGTPIAQDILQDLALAFEKVLAGEESRVALELEQKPAHRKADPRAIERKVELVVDFLRLRKAGVKYEAAIDRVARERHVSVGTVRASLLTHKRAAEKSLDDEVALLAWEDGVLKRASELQAYADAAARRFRESTAFIEPALKRASEWQAYADAAARRVTESARKHVIHAKPADTGRRRSAMRVGRRIRLKK